MIKREVEVVGDVMAAGGPVSFRVLLRHVVDDGIHEDPAGARIAVMISPEKQQQGPCAINVHDSPDSCIIAADHHIHKLGPRPGARIQEVRHGLVPLLPLLLRHQSVLLRRRHLREGTPSGKTTPVWLDSDSGAESCIRGWGGAGFIIRGHWSNENRCVCVSYSVYLYYE